MTGISLTDLLLNSRGSSHRRRNRGRGKAGKELFHVAGVGLVLLVFVIIILSLAPVTSSGTGVGTYTVTGIGLDFEDARIGFVDGGFGILTIERFVRFRDPEIGGSCYKTFLTTKFETLRAVRSFNREFIVPK